MNLKKVRKRRHVRTDWDGEATEEGLTRREDFRANLLGGEHEVPVVSGEELEGQRVLNDAG